MQMNKKAVFAIVFITIGLLIGLAITSHFNIQNQSIAQIKEISSESKGFLGKFSDALAEVTEASKLSVVNISTVRTIEMKEHPFGRFFDDPLFKRFFGEESPFHMPRKYKSRSLGSGVIVRDDGYILTNNHVVKGADEIKIITLDKTEYTGKVIGTDPKTDLAVIRIKGNGLSTVKMGNSDKLQVGEVVIAIGNPYGLNQTVTMGIVSAVGRSNVGIADYEDFIQTDAAINPGNSGGALVNIKGELIGINTAIFSTSGGYQGIGFAIPVNMARNVMESIIEKGKVIRGWLGVHIQDLTPELAKHFGIKKKRGVLVADVVDNSPAEKAGIRRGDLVIEYDGREVSDTRRLRNMVANTMPGNLVELIVIRDNEEEQVKVNIGELPEKLMAQAGEYKNNLQGVDVQELTPELRNRLNIPSKVSGVIVTNIEGESPSYGKLRERDVIQEINRKRIKSISDYRKIVSRLRESDNILLLVYRAGSYIYIPISE